MTIRFNPLGPPFDFIGSVNPSGGPIDTLSAQGGAQFSPLANNFDFSGVASTGAITFSIPSDGLMKASVNYDNTTIGVNASDQLTVIGSYSGSTTTVGAVTQTLLTIPMVANSSLTVDVLISAYEPTLPGAVGSNLIASFIRVGAGVPVLVDTADDLQNISASLSSVMYGGSGSGGNALITVTGQAGVTINWTGVARTLTAS